MSLFASLSSMVQHNQIMQAALVAGPATTATYLMRSVPMKLWGFLKKCVTVEVRWNNDLPDYDAVVRYVTKNVVWQKTARNFNYSAEEKWDSIEEDYQTKHHGLAVGYGTHIGFYRRHLVLVHRQREEADNTSKFKEHTEVTFFTRSKRVVEAFAEDVKRMAGTSDEEFTSVPLYINSGSWWNRAGKLPLRSMDTIFTADDAANMILNRLAEFSTKREENHRLGLPHRIGVLLYGPPGNGKSSLIHALASALGRSIYYLNLGSVDSDQVLTDLVANGQDWNKKLLVLEDFDAAGANTNRNVPAQNPAPTGEEGPDGPKKPVTLSAMLNILDGLIAPDGLMTIATTNHPERLDEALRRPGRFDMAIELRDLGFSEFQRMAALFGKDPSNFAVSTDVSMSGAEMRQMLLAA
jgi:chaperone BCS1